MSLVRQQRLPVVYKGIPLDCDLKMDIVAERILVLEIKSVHALHPVYQAQLHTYLSSVVSGLRCC
jgi:GxxExxY protein